MKMYTIYERPLDYPTKFVVRGFTIGGGSEEPVPDPEPVAVEDTLEAARAKLPAGLVVLPRESGDQPHIVETWL